MKKILCMAIAVILLLSSFSAFAEEATLTVASDFVENSHLTVANSTKVNGSFFTRQFGNNTSDIDVRNMLHGYSPVVWDTQLDFVPDPNVVTDIKKTAAADGTVYTISLCNDLTWNDGTPLNANDYVFALALECAPAFQEIGGDTDVWSHIFGMDAYAAGETPYLSGVRLLDRYTFSVKVKKDYLPYFYEYAFLEILPCPISVIAPDCKMMDNGKGVFIADETGHIGTEALTARTLRNTILNATTGYLSHPYLTCGPYSLVSYDKNEGTVEFALNPYYKGNYENAKPTVATVTLVFCLPQDMPEKLATREIDVINKSVTAETINACMDVTNENSMQFSNYPRLGYAYIGLACEQGPQQFLAVRQAIAYSFDVDDFVQGLLGGYGMADYAYYGIGQWMTQAAMGALTFEQLTEEEQLQWDTMTLDGLNHYDFDPDKALELLIEDGWTLNKTGKPFDPEKDKVRYKSVPKEVYRGGLMPLSFDFGLIENNKTANEVLRRLKEVMEPLGAEFVVHEADFMVILDDYLREEGTREYDMSFLAHNFVSIFDPLKELVSEDEYPGSQNATGIVDEELVELGWIMHYTEPHDVVSFLERWIAFQERFNEILPSVPLYTNIYFDFYPAELQNYDPADQPNWPRALLYAFLSDVPAEPEAEFEGEEEFEDDEEVFFG